MKDRSQRRVVCAAIQHNNGQVILGARHYDGIMHRAIEYHDGDWRNADQGFIDQWGVYMNREEAFEVASAANQILEKTGGVHSKELFSEDLY